jgi:L-ascorbate metabolism protein UlaG (beta-lactamase superfamily)
MKKAISIIFLILFALSNPLIGAEMNEKHEAVTVEWYGHSCFLLTLENGAKILLDPFDTTRFPYSLPAGKVDVVFSTHDHFDHNAVDAVPARVILRADGKKPSFFGKKVGVEEEADGSIKVNLNGKTLTASTIPSFHDDRGGGIRGANGIIRFEVEGLVFAHLGDLGEALKPAQVEKIKPIDVLFVPVGGFYTINDTTAYEVVQTLNPRLVIPMHYRTKALGDRLPISTADAFLGRFSNVKRENSSTIKVQADHLLAMMTVEVLDYHGQK